VRQLALHTPSQQNDPHSTHHITTHHAPRTTHHAPPRTTTTTWNPNIPVPRLETHLLRCFSLSDLLTTPPSRDPIAFRAGPVWPTPVASDLNARSHTTHTYAHNSSGQATGQPLPRKHRVGTWATHLGTVGGEAPAVTAATVGPLEAAADSFSCRFCSSFSAKDTAGPRKQARTRGIRAAR
jgi:hypothetical protein